MVVRYTPLVVRAALITASVRSTHHHLHPVQDTDIHEQIPRVYGNHGVSAHSLSLFSLSFSLFLSLSLSLSLISGVLGALDPGI